MKEAGMDAGLFHFCSTLTDLLRHVQSGILTHLKGESGFQNRPFDCPIAVHQRPQPGFYAWIRQLQVEISGGTKNANPDC
jgi:hypothetical protein